MITKKCAQGRLAVVAKRIINSRSTRSPLRSRYLDQPYTQLSGHMALLSTSTLDTDMLERVRMKTTPNKQNYRSAYQILRQIEHPFQHTVPTGKHQVLQST